MSVILETDNLTRKSRTGMMVDHVTFCLEKGQILGIVGGDGAGKTTLLALLSGLIRPSEGTIRFPEGQNKTRIGLLLDCPALYENMTAYENLNIKRLAAGVKDAGCIKELLKYVGLSNWETVKVKVFSPGMKKRLAIALALIGQPELLLLDEPLKNLDPQSARDIRLILKNTNRDFHTTILLTASSSGEVSGLATELLTLSGGRLSKGAAVSYTYTNTYANTDTNTGTNVYTAPFTEIPGCIRLTAEPLSEAKKVLDSMGIFAYQTKSERMLYVLEQTERREELLKNLKDAEVNVIECILMAEPDPRDKEKGGRSE